MARCLNLMRVFAGLLLDEESGVTAIEYALIAGLISLGIIIWAGSMGRTLSTFFTQVNAGL
jgi:pilus assembly protein Flp/PilA